MTRDAPSEVHVADRLAVVPFVLIMAALTTALLLPSHPLPETTAAKRILRYTEHPRNGDASYWFEASQRITYTDPGGVTSTLEIRVSGYYDRKTERLYLKSERSVPAGLYNLDREVFRNDATGSRHLREQGKDWLDERRPTLEERLELAIEPDIWARGDVWVAGEEWIGSSAVYHVQALYNQDQLVQHLYVGKEDRQLRKLVSEDGTPNGGPGTAHTITEVSWFPLDQSPAFPEDIPD